MRRYNLPPHLSHITTLHCESEKQETQLSQRDRATFRVIEYFAKSFKNSRACLQWCKQDFFLKTKTKSLSPKTKARPRPQKFFRAKTKTKTFFSRPRPRLCH